MKRKLEITNNTELADVANILDGLNHGLSRAEARLAIKHITILETAAIVARRKSFVAVIRKTAKRKAGKMKGE